MDYEPEHYGEFVVRATQDSVLEEWTYLALVFEPHAVYLREWSADAVTELASETTDITHEQNEWRQARVEFSGTDHKTVKVYQGAPGSTLDLVFEATTTLDAGGRLGFGMGVASAALGGWHFKELSAQTPATGDTYGVQVRYF